MKAEIPRINKDIVENPYTNQLSRCGTQKVRKIWHKVATSELFFSVATIAADRPKRAI